MKKNNFEKIFNEISNYYDERIIKYEDTPKSVGQKNIETLEKSMKQDVANMLAGNKDSLKKYKIDSLLLNSLIQQALKSDVDSVKDAAKEEFSRLQDILIVKKVKKELISKKPNKASIDSSQNKK